ncbi:MAG: class I SAM-dependent methyltransferase [Myxococcaceae bacterium]|nr:MAG: class I SAM-dependent methyltransferase [Myxococcaceae bacterium]
MVLASLKSLVPASLKSVIRESLGVAHLQTRLADAEAQLNVVKQHLDANKAPPPPAAPMPITREVIAAQFLRGTGLEIGALHNPTRLPPGVRARYVDVAPIEVLRARFPEGGERITVPDIVDNGEELKSVAESSQDFVIANHFLEHCEDPIGAVKNFIRVLKPGGIIFMAVPDKRFTFDLPRDVTSTDHVIEDHLKGPETSRRAHYDEWLRIIDKKSGEELAHLTELFLRDRVNIHFHVWTFQEMFELFSAARGRLGLPFDIKMALLDPSCLEVVWVLEVTKGRA